MTVGKMFKLYGIFALAILCFFCFLLFKTFMLCCAFIWKKKETIVLKMFLILLQKSMNYKKTIKFIILLKNWIPSYTFKMILMVVCWKLICHFHDRYDLVFILYPSTKMTYNVIEILKKFDTQGYMDKWFHGYRDTKLQNYIAFPKTNL